MPVITHNLVSQFTNRQLNITSDKKAKSAEKLSSGYKINRSADDAAGLQISEKMRSQIRGLNQASQNIQDGISLCQVADGALNETHDILQRMRELSVQAANDTNSEEDRNAIQQEIEQLTKEVDRIANDTSFNEDIYPLLGSGISNGNLGANGIPIAKGYFLFPNLTFTENNYQNLSGYIESDSLGNLSMKFYVHLDGDNHLLSMYALDGTKIFEGSCKHSNSGNDLNADYVGTEYNILATQYTANNYLDQGTAHFLYCFDYDVTVAEADQFFSNSIFECKVVHSATGGGYMGDALTLQSPNSSGSNDVKQQGPLWIQMGAQSGQGMFLNLVNATAKGVGITDPPLDVTDFADASTSISRLDNAINKVSSYRSSFGAQQNRLECAKSVDDNTAENTQNAEARIRDTDMAEEMVEYSKHDILEQAGQAMLAQANQSTQGILSLLS